MLSGFARVSVLLPSVLILFALALAAPVLGTEVEEKLDANELVHRADQIRFPVEPFQVDVAIRNHFPNRDPQDRRYRVLTKGADKSLVMTVAPASERGQVLLMREDDLWAFMPAVSQPIRLPLSQRLTGQVANGDLARAQFAHDYDATLVARETLEGEDALVLELTAHPKSRTATYKRIRYWLDVSDHRPLKAEFYSLSGEVLKTCHYENYQDVQGELRPTRLVMKDNYVEGRYSVLDYGNMKVREIPDKFFTKNYLKRLR